MPTKSANSFQNKLLPVSRIKLNGNLRDVDLAATHKLADSIRENGLINPLTLSSDHYLLGGGHRLKAIRMIGIKRVECRIAPYKHDEPEARLLAIDENLKRRELTVLEEAELLMLREELLIEKGQRRSAGRPKNNGEIISPFATTIQIAREIGMSERRAEQLLQIAKSITQSQRDKIRKTPLANQFVNLLSIARIKDAKRRAAVIRKMTKKNPPISVKDAVRKHRIEMGEIENDLDIIKPSNWWAFGRPKYRQEEGFQGSIPGDVYANALYYFAPTKGVAVDGMAGSGMLKRVYDSRRRWQKNLRFQLTINLYDLQPREPFAKRYGIRKHDFRKPLLRKADWLFIDPPYFSMGAKLYQGELAQTKNYKRYLAIMAEVISAAWESLNTNGVLCLFITPFIDINQPQNLTHDVPNDLRRVALDLGFTQECRIYVSRGEQQRPWAGQTNRKAKRLRRPFSDVCELLVLRRGKDHD